MRRHRSLLRVGLALAATFCLASKSLAAQEETLPPANPTAPAAVLYDQMDSPSTSVITSQNFEADLDAFDSQAADDFVVPAGLAWTISTVEVSGSYTGLSSRPLDSVNLRFYANSGSNLPGPQLYAATLVPSSGLDTGNLVLTLNPPALILPGTYWVSLQANMAFSTDQRQWQWIERTVQNGNTSAFQNPGGGIPPAQCTTWGALSTTCFPGEGHAPDLLFRLSGTEGSAIQTYLPLISR